MSVPNLISIGLDKAAAFDAVILVYNKAESIGATLKTLGGPVVAAETLGKLPVVLANGKPIHLAGTGSLYGEVDDVRKYANTASKAIKSANAMGASKVALVFADVPTPPAQLANVAKEEYAHFAEVALFGILQELYEPLQTREWAAKQGKALDTIKEIGVFVPGQESTKTEEMLKFVTAIERGKILARDVTGADPERGAPKRCAQMVLEAFKDVPSVQVSVIDDYQVLLKEFPLLAAVARASMPVEEHHPCVVRLDYKSTTPDQVKENLFWVGKGITFDTGGADVKTGGYMRAMSRDKGGAGTVSGVMLATGLLSPKSINATAWLAFVRNSIGSRSYTADEIIESRAGKRVLVVNTDAEGRMVMSDLLCLAKEEALKKDTAKARLFTVATLTGHVIRAYGHYPATVDNAAARSLGIGRRINSIGESLGDPWEWSSLRPEDAALIAPGCTTCDVIQADEKPSTMTPRGHQFPAVFMSIAAGLDAHGRESAQPVAYTHLDIAGAVEESPKGLSLGKVNGGPVLSLVASFGK
jgi:leucyl aminopeptidase